MGYSEVGRFANRKAPSAALFRALALLCMLVTVGAHANTQLDQIKAGYLFNFLKFIQWRSLDDHPNEPLVIGILGDDPFEGILQKAVSDQKIGTHPVKVLHFPEASDITRPVHILYIQTLDSSKVSRARAQLKQDHTLYVGDYDNCLEEGNNFCFKVLANRLSFDVNLRDTTKSEVYVNGRLLTLADKVLQ